ncbi:MAG: septum formation initiator family protein [Bacteroidetes bacterium]|nr:septum formation initiator family protein [Bacteroidota bacterium]
MKRIKQIATNKYLLTAACFIVWMVFFDRNDIPQQFRRIHEYQKLRANEENMQNLISDTRDELKLLKTNPATLEKYAREKYLMKKDNEDLFVVTLDSLSTK